MPGRPARPAGAATAGLVAALLLAGPAAAQLPGLTLGPGLLGVASNPVMGGLAATMAVRLTPQTRVRGVVAAGLAGAHAAGRAEAALELVLDPEARAWSPRVSAGVALTARRSGSEEYLLLLAGLEQRPGTRSGWWMEAGVAGGLRLGLGFRWAVRT